VFKDNYQNVVDLLMRCCARIWSICHVVLSYNMVRTSCVVLFQNVQKERERERERKRRTLKNLSHINWSLSRIAPDDSHYHFVISINVVFEITCLYQPTVDFQCNFSFRNLF